LKRDIFYTSDLKYASYILSRGVPINSYRWETNDKGKKVCVFVFYEAPNYLESLICEYLNGEVSRFVNIQNELITLVNQTRNNHTFREDVLEKINKI
jgi:hypothetical protein